MLEVAGKKETDWRVTVGECWLVMLAPPQLSINREERQRSSSQTRDTGYTTVIQQ